MHSGAGLGVGHLFPIRFCACLCRAQDILAIVCLCDGRGLRIGHLFGKLFCVC